MSYPHQKDPRKCQEAVQTRGLMMHYHQCTLKVVKDGFCRIHHPEAVAERRKKVEARQAESYARQPWVLLANAKEEITKLQAKIKRLEKKIRSLQNK
jgi:hypothetical protein